MVFKNKPKLTSKGIPYNYSKKSCLKCSRIFKPMTNVQKYCNLTCQNRVRRERHRLEINLYNKKYSKKYPDRIKLWNKRTNANPEYKENRRLWNIAYSKRDYVRKYRNTLQRRLRKEVPSYRIKANILSRMHKKIETYNKYNKIFPPKSERGLKINMIVNNLMINLPKDFKDKKYQIDHIEPLCSFDLSKKEDFNKAFAPDNHRWLLAEDNRKKIKEDRTKSLRLFGR